MSIEFFQEYVVVLIVAVCLCVGYILKNMINTEKVNRYIPLIMAVLGVMLNIWINKAFTPEILLGGLFSGLASTGMHEAFKNMLGGSKI